MTKIELTLFAPYNEEAALIGAFNDWQPQPMTKGEDGVFRTEIDLQDGEYPYRFRVRSKSWFLEPDAWVEIADPYATLVEDTEDQNAVLRVRGGKRTLDDYVWQHDDAPLPADRELILYELHVADFSGGEDDKNPRGKFVHVTEKLDYLQELGVNALELMPVQEYPGTFSWGYNPRYLFAAESSYGTSEDLKALIDEAHGRGMRVILDMVFNHSESNAPLTQIDHDYWYRHAPKDPDNTWGPEFDFDKRDDNLGLYPARAFCGEVARYWVSEYHIDGIRFDAAKHIGSYDFMHWLVQECKAAAGSKPFYAIAEHIPETPEIVGVDGPMDACWHDSFYHGITAHVIGERFDPGELKTLLDSEHKGFPGDSNLVNYISSHDHGHLMARLAGAGIHDDEAFRRAELAAVLSFTAQGVPMLWMGAEFGEYKEKTLEPSKIDWTLLENGANRALFESYKRLIGTRKAHGALQGTRLEVFFEDAGARVLAYKRSHEGGAHAVVLANFGPEPLPEGYTFTGFPADGTWHDVLNAQDEQVEDGNAVIGLGGFEAKLLIL